MSLLEVGAVCGNSAITDLCEGCQELAFQSRAPYETHIADEIALKQEIMKNLNKIWTRKYLVLIIYQILSQTKILAQSHVKGTVIEKETGNPLANATVISHQMKNGILTDRLGHYIIAVSAYDTLTITYLGFEEKNIIVIGGWHTLVEKNVSMESIFNALPVVNVVANKTHKADSLLNRKLNDAIFEFKKPKVFYS